MQRLPHASERWCADHGGVSGSLEWRDGQCEVTGRGDSWGCEVPGGLAASPCLWPLAAAHSNPAPCERGRLVPGGGGSGRPVHMFDVHVGMWTPWDAKAATTSELQQCCDVCASIEGCTHWLVYRHQTAQGPRKRPRAYGKSPGDLGTVGRCALFGASSRPAASAPQIASPMVSTSIPMPSTSMPTPSASPASASSTAMLPVLLLRSDAQKLLLVTRCHAGYMSWLRSRLAGEAHLELLVDVTALARPAKAPEAGGGGAPGGDGGGPRRPHRRLTRQVAEQLRAALDTPTFAYTVEQLWWAFGAVRHWPSPEGHDGRHNQLSGDVVAAWWGKVVNKYRPLLGARVASRLTSYLIHEPSLVL